MPKVLSDAHQQLLLKSKAFYDSGDYAGAARVLDNLIHKVDRNSAIYSRIQSLRAVVEANLDNVPKARKFLTAVHDRDRDFLYWTYAAEVNRRSKDLKAAEDCIMRALRLKPDNFDVQMMAGVIFHATRHYRDAFKAHTAALKLGWDRAEVWSNAGNTLESLGEIKEARFYFAEAIRLNPMDGRFHANWGSLELRYGDYDRAIDLYREALKLDKLNASAHFGLGLIALAHGDYEAGTMLYEWRWRATEEEKDYPWPRFQGLHSAGPFDGKRILLIGEQGFGDTIMMLRYIPTLETMGMNVSVLCHPSLRRLLGWNFPRVNFADEVISTDDYDCCLPMMGLLYALKADPIRSVQPRRYLSSDTDKTDWQPLRVGIGRIGYCWKGNPEHANDRNRSIDQFEFMQTLSGLPYELTSFVHGEPVKFEDWAHTARALEYINLLITVDTAVAHLAGAMGVPTWLLLPYAADWRWMIPEVENGLTDQTSPWYPSIWIFRQDSTRKWGPVLRRVRQELEPKTAT